MKDFWRRLTPQYRRLERQLAEISRVKEERKLREQLENEAGALAANPLIQQVFRELITRAQAVQPGSGEMDAAACYWYRRGLEEAVQVLDAACSAPERGDF